MPNSTRTVATVVSALDANALQALEAVNHRLQVQPHTPLAGAPAPGATPAYCISRLAVTVLLAVLFATACGHSAEPTLLSQATTRGKVQYILHAPESPAKQRAIIAHGFLRGPKTMEHLAKAFADVGIETACIQFKRSQLWNGNHAENARDMIALRQSLGWKNVTYIGFSAGGLSALIAASEDHACNQLLLLDPVDHGTLGTTSAAAIHIPTLAILGQPGPGNAQRNCKAMLKAIPHARTVEIGNATHCDFESEPSAACHALMGSKPDAARTTEVHAKLLRETTTFLQQTKPASP